MKNLGFVVCGLILVGCGHQQKHESHRGHKGYQHHDHDKAHRHYHKSHKKAHMHGHHDFKDAEKWAKKFNDPKRSEWQKPRELVKLMNLQSGERVADIGAGTGYMIPFLSEAVGEKGRVFGLDVEVSLVEFMNGYIAKRGITNAEARLISTKDPGLLPLKVSKVLLVNTWHHVDQRESYMKRLFAQLKDQSEVYFVEFDYKSDDFGPPKRMRIQPSQLKAEGGSAGFACSKLSESLPRQYVIRCKKG